ncbi:hypothetical protein ACET3Z_016289 [Daucus carota]
MVAKDSKSTGSPKVQVGEIDTRAPFQSVKDAVNMFGEGAFSGERPAIRKARPDSAERVLAKETQLHLAQKELHKLKERLQNVETIKAQEAAELERAKRTVEELSQKLKAVNEAKDISTKATEAAMDQAKKLEESNGGIPTGTDSASNYDSEATRKQYTLASDELAAAKQTLQKIRQDCNATAEAKASALKQITEAEDAAKANMVRASELSKEITVVQESIGQVKVATTQTQQDEAKIYAEKDVQKQLHKAKLEESAKKLLELKEEVNPELTKQLESELAEAAIAIGVIRKDIDSARTSDLDSVKAVTSELDDAKDSLQKVAEEESSLRSLVESLKTELENVKKEHAELKEKENETESVAGYLHVKLRKCKSELEAAITEESKARGASEDLISTLKQLSVECEDAKHESELMKKQAEELKKEAEKGKIAHEEAEDVLKIALMEAEEAKAAESSALDQIKLMSERTSVARASTSESGAQITLSKEEFESLSRKVEESEKLAEMKVAAAMAQVEAVKASENEAIKRLEATQKEIEEIKAATQESLKKAEMAEAAKKAVEGELRKWREREQKKAAETAARILEETEKSIQTEKSIESSPNHYTVQNHYQPEKVVKSSKLEKAKTSLTKKALVPNLSGIFQSKRKQVDGGSMSYLPGERPL